MIPKREDLYTTVERGKNEHHPSRLEVEMQKHMLQQKTNKKYIYNYILYNYILTVPQTLLGPTSET